MAVIKPKPKPKPCCSILLRLNWVNASIFFFVILSIPMPSSDTEIWTKISSVITSICTVFPFFENLNALSIMLEIIISKWLNEILTSKIFGVIFRSESRLCFAATCSHWLDNIRIPNLIISLCRRSFCDSSFKSNSTSVWYINFLFVSWSRLLVAYTHLTLPTIYSV